MFLYSSRWLLIYCKINDCILQIFGRMLLLERALQDDRKSKVLSKPQRSLSVFLLKLHFRFKLKFKTNFSHQFLPILFFIDWLSLSLSQREMNPSRNQTTNQITRRVFKRKRTEAYWKCQSNLHVQVTPVIHFVLIELRLAALLSASRIISST